MISLRKVLVGGLAIILTATAGILTYTYLPVNAAATISASNNQVITIPTTDSLPVNSPITYMDYSGDGNIVLFRSQATNLTDAGGGNGGLYTYNISTGVVTRIDVSTNGVKANYATNYAILSETGRYVLFMSSATNLWDPSTSTQQAIYRRDTQANITKPLTNGVNSGLSQNIDRPLGISNDGRFGLINSRYTANGYPNPYGYAYGDIGTSVTWTQLAKGNDIEGSSNATNTQATMSCDGAFVAYRDDSNIILADIRQGSITKLSFVGSGINSSPIISCNGRYVVYATTNRTDITPTPSGMNSIPQYVRYDRITGNRMYINSNSSGVFATSSAFSATKVSDGGDVVLNYNGYAYLKHLSDGSGTLEPIAKTASGSSINIVSGSLTSNGQYIFFEADPYNLGMASSASTTQLIRAKTSL